MQHPEITWIERTGYPSTNQPKYHYCEECGERLEDREIYADTTHEFLCKDCLLTLHEKRNWW